MRVGSFLRLGMYFGARLIVRAFRPDDGLARFASNYFGGDGLLPVPERDAPADFSGCIACGMCDAAFVYDGVAREHFDGPSDLPLSYSRSLPDYDALERYLAELDKGDVGALERVCPSRVPLRRLHEMARRRGQELRDARAQAS